LSIFPPSVFTPFFPLSHSKISYPPPLGHTCRQFSLFTFSFYDRLRFFRGPPKSLVPRGDPFPLPLAAVLPSLGLVRFYCILPLFFPRSRSFFDLAQRGACTTGQIDSPLFHAELPVFFRTFFHRQHGGLLLLTPPTPQRRTEDPRNKVCIFPLLFRSVPSSLSPLVFPSCLLSCIDVFFPFVLEPRSAFVRRLMLRGPLFSLVFLPLLSLLHPPQ